MKVVKVLAAVFLGVFLVLANIVGLIGGTIAFLPIEVISLIGFIAGILILVSVFACCCCCRCKKCGCKCDGDKGVCDRCSTDERRLP